MSETLFAVLTIVVVLGVALSVAAGLIWYERRLLALWQDRFGPNRVGPLGLGQVVADMLRRLRESGVSPPVFQPLP